MALAFRERNDRGQRTMRELAVSHATGEPRESSMLKSFWSVVSQDHSMVYIASVSDALSGLRAGRMDEMLRVVARKTQGTLQ